VVSDFGTMIILRRRDGADISAPERAAIESLVLPLRTRAEHRSSLGEPLRLRFGQARLESGASGLSLLLSEYWLPEEEDEEGEGGELPEQLLAADRESVGPLVEHLREALGGTYALELIADHW